MTDVARLFWTGRSQAVRLPKAYRFEGQEVRIRRQGCAVILEPAGADWSWLEAVAANLSDDFLEAGRDQPDMPPDQPDVDALFR